MTSASNESPLHLNLHIGGENRPSADGGRAEIRCPADGELVGTVSLASEADLEDAVAAARKALRSWSGTTAYVREQQIRKASAHVRTQADRLGRLMALEQGKPLNQARSEILGACDTLEYYAAEAPRIEGWTNPTEQRDLHSWIQWQPVGVCGLITPWNYPVSLLSWKLGPALAAGCTVVVKPTSVTPCSPLAFCAALTEGGLPAGVVNCIPGPGTRLGEALIRHPKVAKIAMTGSSATGKRILQLAAPFLKKVSLELGGHCPAVVLADADLDLAARTIAYKGFRNCGQSCSSINRVYAHDGVHDGLVQRVVAEAQRATLGHPLSDPPVALGPMTTREGLETTVAHIADAVARGARVVAGGQPPSDPALSRGWYFPPTVLVGCTPEMRVMREETFGPVVAFAAFTDPETAVAQANDSEYGLVSYLFTRDLAATLRLTEALEAGTVCVNHGAVNTNYGPYAGWKDSGYGLELSRRAVFEYLRPKHVKIAVG
ncbi:MAG: aldehyde dehydrogenase family protein [Verrucomicrobia bacterium]|nr:aldehyde dehydrogenase family protein [Verrucomicrobiota bacterium]